VEISIRRGTVLDAEAVSAFVTALSEAYIACEFTPEGRRHFLREHSASEVKDRLNSDFRFYIAEHRGELVGLAAIRSNAHLYYLFVAPALQGTGLAHRLWSQVREESMALGNPGTFTVNSSNYAVRAYEKLGFRRTDGTKESNGVLYNPMEFVSAA
jgi:ribosomal protein S18 acetylase RimI-like enzyme